MLMKWHVHFQPCSIEHIISSKSTSKRICQAITSAHQSKRSQRKVTLANQKTEKSKNGTLQEKTTVQCRGLFYNECGQLRFHRSATFGVNAARDLQVTASTRRRQLCLQLGVIQRTVLWFLKLYSRNSTKHRSCFCSEMLLFFSMCVCVRLTAFWGQKRLPAVSLPRDRSDQNHPGAGGHGDHCGREHRVTLSGGQRPRPRCLLLLGLQRTAHLQGRRPLRAGGRGERPQSYTPRMCEWTVGTSSRLAPLRRCH